MTPHAAQSSEKSAASHATQQGASPPFDLQGGESRQKNKKSNPYAKKNWQREGYRQEKLARAVERVEAEEKKTQPSKITTPRQGAAHAWEKWDLALKKALAADLDFFSDDDERSELWNLAEIAQLQFEKASKGARDDVEIRSYTVKKEDRKKDKKSRADVVRECRVVEVGVDGGGNVWRWSDDDAPVIETPVYCGHRLCLKCARRQAAQTAKEIEHAFEVLGGDKAVRATIFLTFTRRARDGESLRDALKKMHRALERLRRSVAWNQATRGAYIKTEITRGEDGNWWHVHAHALVTLHRDHVGKVIYLNQKNLLALWRKCLKSDDEKDGGVNLQRIRTQWGKTMEISKYLAKPNMMDMDEDLLVEMVKALRYAHLVRRWGCWQLKESETEIRPPSESEAKKTETEKEEDIVGDDLMEGRLPCDEKSEPPTKKEDEKNSGESDGVSIDEEKPFLYVAETGAVWSGALNDPNCPVQWRRDAAIVEKARALLEIMWETHQRRFDRSRAYSLVVDQDEIPNAETVDMSEHFGAESRAPNASESWWDEETA